MPRALWQSRVGGAVFYERGKRIALRRRPFNPTSLVHGCRVRIPAEAASEQGIVHRQCSLGPVDPSFRALSGRLKFTVRRHKFNEDSLFQSSSQQDLLLGSHVHSLTTSEEDFRPKCESETLVGHAPEQNE